MRLKVFFVYIVLTFWQTTTCLMFKLWLMWFIAPKLATIYVFGQRLGISVLPWTRKIQLLHGTKQLSCSHLTTRILKLPGNQLTSLRRWLLLIHITVYPSCVITQLYFERSLVTIRQHWRWGSEIIIHSF